jgi:hypothetical protein
MRCTGAVIVLIRCMTTDKPKILFVADDELLRRIDDFRFGNRISTRAEAIRMLLDRALKQFEGKDGKK